MFKQIFEYYRLNSYSDNAGGAVTLKPNKVLGQTSGDSSVVHIVDPSSYSEFEEDLENEEVDDETVKAIAKRVGKPVYFGDKKRSDVGHYSGNMRQVGALNEKGDHTNTVRTGMSPYKMSKFTGKSIGSGGANQAFRTTGPGVRTSGPYGNSRATYPKKDEDLDPLMFGQEITNKYERSLKKHQHKIKKIKNLLKELDT